jgi:hypothetical protein
MTANSGYAGGAECDCKFCRYGIRDGLGHDDGPRPGDEPEYTMGTDAITGKIVHIHQFEGRDWCLECGWPWSNNEF